MSSINNKSHTVDIISKVIKKNANLTEDFLSEKAIINEILIKGFF